MELRSFWAWSAITMAGASSACAPSQFTTVTLYDTPHAFVRLEADPTVDKNSTRSQPLTIPPDRIAAVLHGVIIEAPLTRMPLYDDLSIPRRHRAFDEHLISFLAPLLALGLEQATPEEVVTFYFSKDLSAVTREVTSGGLFVQGEELHLVLANCRSHTRYMADYGAAEMNDDRLTPMRSLAPQEGRLSFDPPEALRPPSSGLMTKLVQPRTRELIVSYRQLTPYPLDTAADAPAR